MKKFVSLFIVATMLFALSSCSIAKKGVSEIENISESLENASKVNSDTSDKVDTYLSQISSIQTGLPPPPGGSPLRGRKVLSIFRNGSTYLW